MKSKLFIKNVSLSLQPAITLVSLFVSPDHGAIVQDAFPLTPTYSRLLGVQVPFLYLLNDSAAEKKVW